MMRIRTLVFTLGAFAFVGGPAPSAEEDVIKARATLNSCTDGSQVGSATLFEERSSEGVKEVTVLVSARNMTTGKHAVHIHEVGACDPCSAAGSHLDLGPFGNNVPVTANHPYHSGDLINVRVGGVRQRVHVPCDQPHRTLRWQPQHLRRGWCVDHHSRIAGRVLPRPDRSELRGRRARRLRDHPTRSVVARRR